MAARSPLPSPPLSNYSYDAPPPPLMSITTSSSSATSTPGPASAPSVPPPPAPPTQPSTIAPPPIQTANDIADAEKVKKKHVCPTCTRPFTTSGHLARHLRVHTGERNHKCPFPGCETRCSRQDNLQQHYRIHLSPRSRRNSNAATRAAIAKAMEAQAASAASGGSPQPAASPSTTLTLPPQPAARHPPHGGRAPPSPIENALGLDSPNGPPAYAGRPTLAVHHPSAVPPRYPPGQFGGYDSPRSSSASSVQSGANANGASNPSAAYPSPYSTGPVHHPLPPTGASSAAGNRSVSYDRVNGGANFQSPQSPAPNAYPSPEESHHSASANGYGGSYNGQQGGYSSHSTYIPPPASAAGYYPAQRAPTNPSSYSSGHPQSPPPILPPIQSHHPNQWSRYPPQSNSSWHTSGPAQGGHGSSSESGDEGGSAGQGTPQGGNASSWSGSHPQRPVSVSGGGPGGSY